LPPPPTWKHVWIDVLRQEIEEDRVKLAILFGNAGDGKTAFLQHLLAALGVPDVHSSQRVQERRLADGRMLKVNLDGSAAWQGRSANALLDQFFQPCHELGFSMEPHATRGFSRSTAASCSNGWRRRRIAPLSEQL
jgi:hypothetical protein